MWKTQNTTKKELQEIPSTDDNVSEIFMQSCNRTI